MIGEHYSFLAAYHNQHQRSAFSRRHHRPIGGINSGRDAFTLKKFAKH